MAKAVRIVLLTNTISRPGGAEYVAMAMFNSLRELSNVRVDRSIEVIAHYRNSYGVCDQCVRHAIRHALHYLPLKVTRLVLANSNHVANLLKDLGIHAKVLYPPVRSREVTQYTSGARWSDRERLVITVSRIAGKQLEPIPLIASRVKDARFILAGPLSDEDSYAKLLKLKKLLKAENFLIMPNPPREKLYELLGNGIVYLNTTHHETFGTAVAEGMAAGCIPVVHRSGGPYHDILNAEEGAYGFSHRNLEEAVTTVKNITEGNSDWEKLSEEARQRSLMFDESIFSSKVSCLVRAFGALTKKRTVVFPNKV